MKKKQNKAVNNVIVIAIVLVIIITVITIIIIIVVAITFTVQSPNIKVIREAFQILMIRSSVKLSHTGQWNEENLGKPFDVNQARDER